jgi:hypothetical protein
MAAGVGDAVEQLGRRRHQVSTPVGINRQHAAAFRVDARPQVGA